MSEHRNKRCVIAEELLSICDDFREAAVLRQMLYWLPRRHDIDDYLREEKKRRGEEMEIAPSNGWIYKSASQLSEETMILSRSTAYRRLQTLEEKGYLHSRDNPESDWDNTKQYRLDVLSIQSDLKSEGYHLATVMGRDYPSVKKLFDQQKDREQSTVQSETSGVQGEQSSVQSGKTFTETTTETTTERGAHAHEGENGSVGQEAIDLYHEMWPRRLDPIVQDRVRQTVTDLDTWSNVLEYWKMNGHRARSVGKMLDRYKKSSGKGGDKVTDEGYREMGGRRWDSDGYLRDEEGDKVYNERGYAITK